MKDLALVKLITKEYSAGVKQSKSAGDHALRVINHFINSGEGLLQLKKQKGSDWNDFSESGNLPFSREWANRQMRMAIHKLQARHIASTTGVVSVDVMVKGLPKASEPPLLTFADDADVSGQTGKTSDKRDKDDWQTPIEYVEAARTVMGSINLDPFSSVRANGDINADRFFTLTDDAYNITWAERGSKTVWMNPPYSHGAANKATEKFLAEYDHGSFNQGIVLMNSATDTHWFHDMCKAADAICLTHGRIAFISGDKQMSSNTKGQVFFYFGSRKPGFRKVFSQYGMVVDTGDYK